MCSASVSAGMARGVCAATVTNRTASGASRPEHLVHILVCHDADQKNELLPGEAVSQALHRGTHSVGVVAAVQQERGRVPQQFKAARPADRFKTSTDGAFRDVPAMCAHHPQSVIASAAFRGW